MTFDVPELKALRAVSADPGARLEERIEAFEDFIDAEVGDTDLVRARNIERESGARQIFVKFEGGNPTGTQKDRIAFAQVLEALRRGEDAVTIATCGNYGSATSLAAAAAGIRAVVFLPSGYHSRRTREMEANGTTEIVRIEGDYEHAVEASREYAVRHDICDANPGGDNSSLQLRAYGEIAAEIYDELGDAPAAVAVPVSNGTTLAGVYRGFGRLYRRGRTSRMPHIVAGSSYRQNPIVNAWLDDLPECVDLEPGAISETAINEPLINWHSIDGEQALQAIRDTGGWADFASDTKLVQYSRLLRQQQGLSVLPAATAGLAALLRRHARQPLPNDRYVAIVTGRNG